jgi:protein-tyrosine phosphatase
MIDLHCHILPGIDDGAETIGDSLAMARAFVEDGVTYVACTPHILPGAYSNAGPSIIKAVHALQAALEAENINLRLVAGADNHVVPDFLAALKSGHLLSLGGTRYVLVEPPHHVPPPRLEDLFFSLVGEGYVPILTHPERLTWTEGKYDLLRVLVDGGVWMQLTAGSLAGRFGKRVEALSMRMLDDGLVHILATDAHDTSRRPPKLSEGWQIARDRVGAEEAERLVLGRPLAILGDEPPANVVKPSPVRRVMEGDQGGTERQPREPHGIVDSNASPSRLGRLARGLRRLFQ